MEEKTIKRRSGDDQSKAMTLSDWLARVGRAIHAGSGLPCWVELGVVKVTVRPGFVSFEAGDANRVDGEARLRLSMPVREFDQLSAAIGTRLDPMMLEGQVLLAEIVPVFHRKWHLSADVTRLHPSVAQGLMATRKAALREQLKASQDYDRQRRLSLPRIVQHVAIIAPSNSAGLADVRRELEILEKAGVLRVTWHPCPFESVDAATQLALAIAQSARAKPDLILMVRGGGAAAGLAALDQGNIVFAVARSPIPIITGLGHATDKTLCDEVAFRSEDTPSKALGWLIGLIKASGRQEASELDQFIAACMARLENEEAINQRLQKDLLQGSDRLLIKAEAGLKPMAIKLLHGQRSVLVQLETCARQIRDGLALLQKEPARQLDEMSRELRATVVMIRQAAGQMAGPQIEQSLQTSMRAIGFAADRVLVAAEQRQRWLRETMPRGVSSKLDAYEDALRRATKELAVARDHLLINATAHANTLFEDSVQHASARISDAEQCLHRMMAAIKASAGGAALQQGFAMIIDADQHWLRNAEALRATMDRKQPLIFKFRDGTVTAILERVPTASTTRHDARSGQGTPE